MARLFKVASLALIGVAGARCLAGARRVLAALGVYLLIWLVAGLLDASAAEPNQPKKPKPAVFSISGYGVLGNRELKRILRTVELGDKKPDTFGASFVEDSALILAARVKRDGYLEPAISVRLWLENGQVLDVRGADLLENPLPRPLRITRVHFTIVKGVLYHFQDLRFEGLESITAKEARAYFIETDMLLHLRSARVFTQERLQRGLSSLTDILDRQGYAQATAKADRVVRDNKTGSVDVQITVHQGPKVIVRSVREEFFYGASALPESSQTVYPNKPYSKLWQQDYALSLRTNVYRQGFPDAKVELETLKRDVREGRVDLDLRARVKAGDQFWISRVEFKGEQRTENAAVTAGTGLPGRIARPDQGRRRALPIVPIGDLRQCEFQLSTGRGA